MYLSLTSVCVPFRIRQAMYSMIQFGAVILTYFQGSVLGNWQYLVSTTYATSHAALAV